MFISVAPADDDVSDKNAGIFISDYPVALTTTHVRISLPVYYDLTVKWLKP